ncbi:MAG: T9SS type A sorting domain-containing protein [Bacteroidetes bacterium]|nr:T9SS type A sorting domain-containing protein [Bacteroidota bacterium]
MRANIFLTFLTIMLSLSVFGQQYTFKIKGPKEACSGKFEEWSIETSNDNTFPAFHDVSWDVEDFSQGVFNNQGTGKTFNYFVNYQPSAQVRVVRINAHVTIMENNLPKTYTDTISVKIVHPHFFQLKLNTDVDCDANSLVFILQDKKGLLTEDNMQNISWEVPPYWKVTAGSGSNSVVVKTNSIIEGKNKVKVIYEAVRRKDLGGGIIDKKKCHAKTAIEVEIDVKACLNVIPYSSVPENPYSHSGQTTVFDGSTILPPNIYNFVSGGEIDLLSTFDFSAISKNELNLFIESCSCESNYRDPNYEGDVSVRISDYLLGKRMVNGSLALDLLDRDAGHNHTDFSIFPNPTEGDIYLSGFPINEILRIEILSNSGNILKKVAVHNSDNGQALLSLMSLSPGVYNLVIHYKGGVYHKLILKI